MTDTNAMSGAMSGAIASDAGIAGVLPALLARAQSDREFRTALLQRPATTLIAHGAALPGDWDLRPVDAAPDTTYLVLPPAPAEGEVSDSELEAVSGGVTPAVTSFMVVASITAYTIYQETSSQQDQ